MVEYYIFKQLVASTQELVNDYRKTLCLPNKGRCKFTTLGDLTYKGVRLSPLSSQTAGRLLNSRHLHTLSTWEFPSFVKDAFNNCPSFSFLHNRVSE